MKRTLSFLAAIALTSSAASAAVLFAPDPATATNTPSVPPLLYTAGTPYTQTVSGAGTITYSPTTITVGDASDNSSKAYISSSEQVAHTDVVFTSLTFTPHYSNADATGGVSGQSNMTILTLLPNSGSNNNVLSVTLQTLGYGVNRASVLLDSGIAYGGGTKTGAQEYDSHGVNSLNGVALTLNVRQIFVTNPGGTSTITTTGRLSDAANSDLYDYNYVVSNVENTGYDPGADFGPGGGLLLRTGLVSVSSNDGFTNPGATLDLSNISVTVPEPASVLLIGGMGSFLLGKRRRAIA